MADSWQATLTPKHGRKSSPRFGNSLTWLPFHKDKCEQHWQCRASRPDLCPWRRLQRLVCTPLPRGATLPRCLSGPGPAARWLLPLGPPWTLSTASSPPTQETAPGSSPTFNPRDPSSSSTSHLRDSGCPYSPPCAPSSVRTGGMAVPGGGGHKPTPRSSEEPPPSWQPCRHGAPAGAPQVWETSEHCSPQQLEGPLGCDSLLAAVNHAGGEPRRRWTGGKPSSARDTEVGNFSKSGSGHSGVLPSCHGMNPCAEALIQQDRGLTRGRQISPCVPLLSLSPSNEDISWRRPKEALSLTVPAPSSCSQSPPL